MSLYEVPKSQLETEHHFLRKRWNFVLAFQLITIPYLLFLFISIFMGMWYVNYISMLDFMKKFENKTLFIDDKNIFMHMFSFNYIPFSLILMLITGIIPVGFVSYFQTKKVTRIFQFIWFVCVLALFDLMLGIKGL